ncbi:MAG TPA: endonuclease MutS2 [Desulfomonilaceae bacterium]|nr:endonuclease MutS2 [Desulfomonilaceae bacterium]
MPVFDEPFSDVISESLESLELTGVLEEVALHALSLPGKEEVLAALPEADANLVRTNLNLVAEFKEMIGLNGPLELAGLTPMEGINARLENPGAILDVEEILAVADLLYVSGKVRDRLENLKDLFELLRGEAGRIDRLDTLERRIKGIFDEHGNVRAAASKQLLEIRERMRSVRERMRKRLESIVQDRELERVVQEDYVTLRNDRYVILLRPEFKGLLDGIVHDHSRSGSSVYVEPLSVVELNNQVASLIDEERDEIRRIFIELTEEIRTAKDMIFRNYKILAVLDAFQARALYARAVSCVLPILVESGFRILGARHPLLLAADAEGVIPMDVIQDPSTSAMVISGANMGGKTVALKIAGLFPLMTRCAIMLPAKEGTEIQLFNRIMADIGDEQDIRGRISSFSGHMTRIKAVVENAAKGDLVLLDELGGATDPEEGSALAMAVMDKLIDKGAKVVVTTHLTHLKAYALGREDAKNVSVEFHPRTLKPTFRLLYDLPGESHAILTAERIGLGAEVIRAARNYLDTAAGGSSKLLVSLRRKMSEVERLREDLVEKQRYVDEERARINAQKQDIIEEFRKEARTMIRNAERRIMGLQESIKSGKMKRSAEERKTLERIKSEIVETLGVPLERHVPAPAVGSRVKVETLGREGVVKAISDAGRVEVAIGNMTLRAAPEDLILLGPYSLQKSSSKNRRIGIDMPLTTPRWEVNVIGLRVEDALPIIDKALDDALLGGLSSVNIIHGKGTGRLKKAIWEHLSGRAFVRDLQAGDIHAGGAGVTVVMLASN